MQDDQTNIIGIYPNKTTRKLLAGEWKTLNEEQKLVLRAARSRRGIRCDICGTVGYFRENCPNGCTSPPRTPDSMASTPPASPRKREEAPSSSSGPVGILWRSATAIPSEKKKSAYDIKKRPDMNQLRPQAMETLTKLTATFDTTLLHPPMEKVGETFYPNQLTQDREHKDYFIQKTLKQERSSKLKYKNQASLRPPDDLDSFFRAGSLDDSHLYHVNPRAGESIHAKNTWKSILAKHDTLANSDPALAQKQAKLDELFTKQSQWIASQQQAMTFRNDRFEHLVHVLQSEMKKEHARDANVLATEDPKERKRRRLKVWTERLESVDRLIRLLHAYHFSAGLEEADYLIFCLEQWKVLSEHQLKSIGQEERTVSTADGADGADGGDIMGEGEVDDEEKMPVKQSSPRTRRSNHSVGKDLIAASTNPYYPDQVFLEAYKKKTARIYQKSKSGTVFTAAQHREEVARQQASQLEKIQNMSKGGMANHSLVRAETLPAMVDILAAAQKEAEDFAVQDAKREAMIQRYKQSLGGGHAAVAESKQRRVHPRERDAKAIAKMKRSFRLAGLGRRIRQGKDTDPAHALPALIPIPRAFDGDSKIQSYTADNIVYGLKKQMVLSDIGYTPQQVVPLYVRTTLEEEEGTSLLGDPCKEELAQDRRYSHYLGRPLVRFNEKVVLPTRLATASTSASMSVAKSTDKTIEGSSLRSSDQEDDEEMSLDLSSLSFPDMKKRGDAQTAKIDKKTKKELQKAKEEAGNLPITTSLVRMVFTNPNPTLDDLKFLDEYY
eukprot:scaffold5903_cov165-Ochromonas_danica.AAC.11